MKKQALPPSKKNDKEFRCDLNSEQNLQAPCSRLVIIILTDLSDRNMENRWKIVNKIKDVDDYSVVFVNFGNEFPRIDREISPPGAKILKVSAYNISLLKEIRDFLDGKVLECFCRDA